MAYSYQRTVHLADTDAAGVVYFAQLLHICHEAYETCLTAAGIDWQGMIRDKIVAIPITHAEIDFFKPIHWGDRLTLHLAPKLDNNSQFTVYYRIYPDLEILNGDRPLATALTRHVAINPRENRRSELPEPIQNWLKSAVKPEDSKI